MLQSWIIFILCTLVTILLHTLHKDWMAIIVDSGTLVGITMLVLNKK